MSGMRKSTGWMLLLVAILVLSACTPATPTLDANMVYTSAAQTVVAQLSQTAAAMPSLTATPTPVLATATTQPTLELPTLAQLPSLSALTLTPFAVGTLKPPVGTAADKAVYVGQTPLDGALVTAGAKFDVTWSIKNVGPTTWSTLYSFRRYSCTNANFFDKDSINLSVAVKPGETAKLTTTAFGPAKDGDYYCMYVLTNDQGVNFSQFTLTIKVVNGTAGTGSAPFAVISAQGSPKTNCLSDVNTFKAVIITNGAGNVRYHWLRSKGPISDSSDLSFASATDIKEVEDKLGDPTVVSDQIVIESPTLQIFGVIHSACP